MCTNNRDRDHTMPSKPPPIPPSSNPLPQPPTTSSDGRRSSPISITSKKRQKASTTRSSLSGPCHVLRSRYADLQTDTDRAELAASFIRDARAGRFEHGEASGKLRGGWNAAAFGLYYDKNWIVFVYGCFSLQLLVALVIEDAIGRWEEGKEEEGGQSLKHMALLWKAAFAQFILAWVHVVDATLKVIHMRRATYFKKGWWNRSTIVVRLAILFDTSIFLLCLTLFQYIPVRLTTWLIPAILLTRNRELRQLWDGIYQTLPDVAEVLGVLALVLGTFGVIAASLFGDNNAHNRFAADDEFQSESSSSSSSPFASPAAALGSLSVLITGDNFPDVAADPQTNQLHTSTILLFTVAFMIVAAHVVMPIALAVVVDTHGTQQRAIVRKDRKKEQRALLEAFHVMTSGEEHRDKKLSERGIDRKSWHRLMYALDPTLVQSAGGGVEQCDLLFETLNRGEGRGGNGKASTEDCIDAVEFQDTADVLTLEFHVSDVGCEDRMSKVMGRFIANDTVPRVGAWLALLEIVTFLAFGGGSGNEGNSILNAMMDLFHVSCVMFSMLELTVWVVAMVRHGRQELGVSTFAHTTHAVAVVCAGLDLFFGRNWLPSDLLDNDWNVLNAEHRAALAQIIRAIAGLRLLRAVSTSSKLRTRFEDMLSVASYLHYLFVALGCVLWLFADIGVTLFHDIDPRFGSVWDAFVHLFICLHGSGWGDSLDIVVTNSNNVAWGVLYGIFWCSFFVVGSVLLLNLLLAIVVEAFTVQERKVSSFSVDIGKQPGCKDDPASQGKNGTTTCNHNESRQPMTRDGSETSLGSVNSRRCSVYVVKRVCSWKRELHGRDDDEIDETQPEDLRQLFQDKKQRSSSSSQLLMSDREVDNNESPRSVRGIDRQVSSRRSMMAGVHAALFVSNKEKSS